MTVHYKGIEYKEGWWTMGSLCFWQMCQ